MGMSVDAILAYGIFWKQEDRTFDLPWLIYDEDDYIISDQSFDEPDDWWRSIHGWISPDVLTWGEEKLLIDAFDIEHPIPFDIVRCGWEYDDVIIYPRNFKYYETNYNVVKINPSELTVPNIPEYNNFLNKYFPNQEPCWNLIYKCG